MPNLTLNECINKLERFCLVATDPIVRQDVTLILQDFITAHDNIVDRDEQISASLDRIEASVIELYSKNTKVAAELDVARESNRVLMDALEAERAKYERLMEKTLMS